MPIAVSSDKMAWHIWDPPLVERHPKTGKVTRLAETGYPGIRNEFQCLCSIQR
ncbi:MAG: hypothetical protein CM1200mP2_15690 [Planctomycetaceae bacterium]|nr:MAG: hypothetical protein CM1200mP2_15690 [Planctomycetaceae bacterium]